MPASNTYESISSVTLTSNSTDVTFGSIPSTYTDLILIVSGSLNYGGADRTYLRLQIGSNGVDTGSNYSTTELGGNGTTAISARASNSSSFFVGVISEKIGTTIIHFNNYSNTTTNKTIISRGNSNGAASSEDVGLFVSLWRSTAAINIIKLYGSDGTPFKSGTTFSLYGIKAA